MLKRLLKTIRIVVRGNHYYTLYNYHLFIRDEHARWCMSHMDERDSKKYQHHWEVLEKHNHKADILEDIIYHED